MNEPLPPDEPGRFEGVLLIAVIIFIAIFLYSLRSRDHSMRVPVEKREPASLAPHQLPPERASLLEVS